MYLVPAKTLPPRTPAPSVPMVGTQVQAMYSFEASIGNQLSFLEGDIIGVMGEISDGWQYGQNMRSQQYVYTVMISGNEPFTATNFKLIKQHETKTD